MSQVVIPSGHLLGHGVYRFEGEGDPNSRSDRLLTSISREGNDSVSLGSLYLERATGALYNKTGRISVASPTGTWTAK